jgi:hypothetical protein
MKKINYLSNKELLIQIQKSKVTYSEFQDPKYREYDAIIGEVEQLTDDDVCREMTIIKELVVLDDKKPEEVTEVITEPGKTVAEFIQETKEAKLKKMRKADPDCDVEVDDIMTGDLVFRYMTFDHIPEDPNWDPEKVKKKRSDGFMKVNFPPFQHWILENGVPRCVGQSHYKNSEFSVEHGKTNDKLGKMYMLLVEKISKKGNWRNYTYLEDMKGDALRQLSQVGLQFDESRSRQPNPFAFYTTIVNNAFKRILNGERRMRDIRDDLIELKGELPSFTRQLEAQINDEDSDYNSNKPSKVTKVSVKDYMAGK